jgi:putative ABC transport system ATP-binding protein
MGEQEVHALRGVSFDIQEGEFVAVMGPSGSGKSSLMNLIGALDTPTSGTLSIDGRELSQLGRDELADLRNETLGFVFQQFNLLPRQNALANVRLPLRYARKPVEDEEARARECLELVGLGERMDHRPMQLSGGQQQRVAIARALANRPRILLADEPTGALDTATTGEIMQLLTDLNRQGITVIVVTHEPEVADYASRHILFRDGRIEADRRHAPRSAH